MIGTTIESYYVYDEQTGKDSHKYKTLNGAKKHFDEIQGHAIIKQETTCVNQDITILEK